MANTYLQRTPSSDGNRRTWTFSAWVKISALSSNTIFDVGINGQDDYTPFFFQNDGKIRLYEVVNGTLQNYNLITNRLFRDTSAWYHLVYRVDTTQSTASDRIRLYVNGVQETSFSTATYPSQNYATLKNSTSYANVIGVASDNYGANFYNGSMSHIHFCDGYSYDATSFGETDATTGEWKIKTSPSVTYGTNGFFILKDGNSVTDQSGNSNNFTVGGGTLTKTEDSPSNVFATLNPLSTPSTLSNGNLQAVYAGSGSYATASSTLGMTSGKYYCEVKLTLTNNYPSTGICATNSDHATIQDQADWLGSDADTYGMYTNSGQVYNTGSVVNTFGAISTGDILGMALDLDSAQNTLKYYKNGSLIGTQNIATNSNGWMFGCTNQSTGSTNTQFNFGNGYFGTTAVSSAGTNASGIGIFEYDVPTGYTALSTKGLNL